MNTLVTNRLRTIPGHTITGAIVHIGAGRGEQTDVYLGTKARSIHLIEPNPAFQDRLETRTSGDARLHLCKAAISDKDGSAPLKIFNFADLSTLEPPSELNDLYPGLRLVDTQTVPTLSLQSMLCRMTLSSDDSNLLVIEAIGREEATVRALVNDAPNLFDHVLITCAIAGHSEGITFQSRLDQIFEDIGYEGSAGWEAGVRLYRIDRVKRQNVLREARLSDLESELSDAQIEIGLQKTLVEQLREALKLMTERSDWRQARRFEAEAEAKQAKAELAKMASQIEWHQEAHKETQRTLEKMQAEAAEGNVRIEALRATISDLEAKLGAQHEDLATAQRSVADVEAQKAALQTKIEDLENEAIARKAELNTSKEAAQASMDRQAEQQAQIDTLNTQIAAHGSETEALKNDLATAETAQARAVALEVEATERDKIHRDEVQRLRNDFDVTLQMQTITTADLSDLRKQYQALLERKEEQDELIAQLVQRLEEASEHLRTEPERVLNPLRPKSVSTDTDQPKEKA